MNKKTTQKKSSKTPIFTETQMGVVKESFEYKLDLILENQDLMEKRLETKIIKITNQIKDELKAEISGVRDELKTEISGVRDELKAEISGVRDELKAEISGVRDELKAEISGVRDELKAEISGVRDELKAEIGSNARTMLAYLDAIENDLAEIKQILSKMDKTKADREDVHRLTTRVDHLEIKIKKYEKIMHQHGIKIA